MGSLAVTGAVLAGEAVGLRADGGYIVELGPEVAPREGDEVIDAAGKLLVPPFVNAHGHAAMTLFRGFGDDLPLMEWLEEKIWPAEVKLQPEDVYWGTRLACVEMLRSGTPASSTCTGTAPRWRGPWPTPGCAPGSARC